MDLNVPEELVLPVGEFAFDGKTRFSFGNADLNVFLGEFGYLLEWTD